MKIYQVHIIGNCYDDCYDNIDSSYVKEEKAIARKNELEEKLQAKISQAVLCEDCFMGLKKLCDDFKSCPIQMKTKIRDYCANYKSYPKEYDYDEYYTIEELDVIE